MQKLTQNGAKTKALKVRAKIRNFLEENVSITLYDLGLDNNILRYDTQTKGKK